MQVLSEEFSTEKPDEPFDTIIWIQIWFNLKLNSTHIWHEMNWRQTKSKSRLFDSHWENWRDFDWREVGLKDM